MQRIVLSDADRAELIGHARRCEPDESCAILIGRGERVARVFLTDNADASPSSFSVPEQQLIDAYAAAGREGADVVGIFHSHPDSEAYPSGKDERFMEANPVAWVIYSGASGDLRAYVLGPGITEIPVVRTQVRTQ